MCAELSYAALPREEKIKLVCELRPRFSVQALAEMFGVSTRPIFEWTRDMKIDLRRKSSPDALPLPVVQRTDEDFCHCSAPARDAFIDAFCRRGETCIYCTKPKGRTL
jgi:hypothetical protein